MLDTVVRNIVSNLQLQYNVFTCIKIMYFTTCNKNFIISLDRLDILAISGPLKHCYMCALASLSLCLIFEICTKFSYIFSTNHNTIYGIFLKSGDKKIINFRYLEAYRGSVYLIRHFLTILEYLHFQRQKYEILTVPCLYLH